MGSGFRGRDVDLVVGMVMDGLRDLLEDDAVEAIERVSWSAETVAESGSPYSSVRCRQSHSLG
jgi:hypothetical protein